MKQLAKAFLLLNFFASLLFLAPQVHAGTNLTVTCPNIGVCSISPSGTPLFDEAGWMPGSTQTQFFSVSNVAGVDGFSAVEVTNYLETKNLGAVIDVQIHRDSPVGPVIYGGVTLHEFRDDGYFTIDSLTAGETTSYYVTATMRPSAGNPYKGASVVFDLNMGLELLPIPPTSGGGSGTGSVLGTVSTPVCNATTPSSAPFLTITSVGTNTVTLSWSGVSPVTHYGLTFTRNSDGATYGSPNIGNTNTYTVTNLSGGANYTFQVYGVNDCAPGPLSNSNGSGQVPGPTIQGNPTGPGGEILGVTEPKTETASGSGQSNQTEEGQVAGETTCETWKSYLPWYLLLIQIIVVLILELIMPAKKAGLIRYLFSAIVMTIGIIVFYILRECSCFSFAFLAILCKWYWLFAIVLLIIEEFVFNILNSHGSSTSSKRK